MKKDPNDLEGLAAHGIRVATMHLVKKAELGDLTASELAQLRAIHRDAGGTLAFGGAPTALGDDVLASMADLDPNLLN
jgi:hypothetical protein